jgi:hypothetical protein
MLLESEIKLLKNQNDNKQNECLLLHDLDYKIVTTNNILPLTINNDCNIIVNNNIYLINLRLIKLMKKMYIDKKIILYIIYKLKQNINLNLYIINNKIKIY